MKNLVTNPWGRTSPNDEIRLLLTENGKLSIMDENNPVRLFWSYHDGPAHDPEMDMRIVVKTRYDNYRFFEENPKKLNVTSRYRLYTDPIIFQYLSSPDSREIKAGFWKNFSSRDISFWVFGKEIRKTVTSATYEGDMTFIATVQGTAVSETEMQVYVDGEYRGIWPRN